MFNALTFFSQAVVREQQKSQEVLRLQEAITNLMKQADEQRKKEVFTLWNTAMSSEDPPVDWL